MTKTPSPFAFPRKERCRSKLGGETISVMAELDSEAEAVWSDLVATSLADERWDSEFTPSPHSTSKARARLVALGPRAAPTLLLRLGDMRQQTRYEALWALDALGAAGEPASNVLAARIALTSGLERSFTARALCSVTRGTVAESDLAIAPETRLAVMEWTMEHRPLDEQRRHVERLLRSDAAKFVLCGDGPSLRFRGLVEHPELVVPDLVRPFLSAPDADVRQAAVTALRNAAADVDAQLAIAALVSARGNIGLDAVEGVAYFEGSDALVAPFARAGRWGCLLVLVRCRRDRGLVTRLGEARAHLEELLEQRGEGTGPDVGTAIEIAAEVAEAAEFAWRVDAVVEHDPEGFRHHPERSGVHIHDAYSRYRAAMGRARDDGKSQCRVADDQFVSGNVKDLFGRAAHGRYERVLRIAPRVSPYSAHAAFQLAWIARAFGAAVDDRWAEFIASLGFADEDYLAEVRGRVPALTGGSLEWRPWPPFHAEDERYLDRASRLEAAGLYGAAARELLALAETKETRARMARSARAAKGHMEVDDLVQAAAVLEARAWAHVVRVGRAFAKRT